MHPYNTLYEYRLASRTYCVPDITALEAVLDPEK
jgi:hypothetical protein